MAGKTDVFENELLALIFHGTPITGLADNAGSAPLANLYLSLHTQDPTDSAPSGQSTYETTYTGYARVPLARSSVGWTITGNSVSPTGNVLFGTCTLGSASITHIGIGTAASGGGKLLYSGSVTPIIAVSPTITPTLTSSSTLTED